MKEQAFSSENTTKYFIWRLILFEPLLCAINAIFWIFFHSWPLLVGLLSKQFFDSLERGSSAGLNLGTIVALIVVTGFAKVGIIFTTTKSGVPLSFRIRGLLQRNLISQILKRTGVKRGQQSSGEAISTLRDDTETAYGIITWGFDVIAAFIFAVSCIGILLWVSVKITLLVFIPMAIIIAIATLVRGRLEDLRSSSRKTTASVTEAIAETFQSIQAIQLAGAEASMLSRLEALSDARGKSSLAELFQGQILTGIYACTTSLGGGLTLLLAASEMRSGTFSVGDFAIFASYLMQLQSFTEFLGYLFATYQQTNVSFRRLVDLLGDAQPKELVLHHNVYLTGDLPNISIPSRKDLDRLNSLEICNVSYAHAESGAGIQDISFQAERGSITVIVGRIGSGKSTLLRALLGIIKPESGEIKWNGENLNQKGIILSPPYAVYTPQVPSLISGTIRDNIQLGLSYDNSELEEAVYRSVFEKDLAGFTKGLETEVGVRGLKMSGGQVKRIAIARSIIRKPDLMIFDDISSGLDTETESHLWNRVIDSETSYLLVSHSPEILRKADNIIILKEGRLVGQGKLEELLINNEEMRRLCVGDIHKGAAIS